MMWTSRIHWRLTKGPVDDVVGLAHPLAEGRSAGNDRGMVSDKLLPVLGTVGARVEPRENVDQILGVLKWDRSHFCQRRIADVRAGRKLSSVVRSRDSIGPAFTCCCFLVGLSGN